MLSYANSTAFELTSTSVSRAALADSKATIADVTRLRWEVESRESDLKQQLAAVLAEGDDLKAKLQLQREDSVQVQSSGQKSCACRRVFAVLRAK